MIIIDTDFDLDDVCTLALFRNNKKWKYLSLCEGALSPNESISYAKKLLNFFKRTDVTILVTDGARSITHKFPRSITDRKIGILEKYLGHYEDININVQKDIRSVVKKKTDVICLGSLVNIEILVETPHLIKHIRLFISGSNLYHPGNVDIGNSGINSEWNIYFQPISSKKVLESNVMKTLIPLDTSVWFPINSIVLVETKNEMLRFVQNILDGFEISGDITDIYMWDMIAGIGYIYPQFFGVCKKISVSCDNNGITIFNRKIKKCRVLFRPHIDMIMNKIFKILL